MSREIAVEALVLRRRDSGESDRKLTLLSKELGKIDVTARGARKPTSRFAAMSEPLVCGTFVFHDSGRSKFLTQAEQRRSFRAIRSDYDRLTLCMAFLELVDAFLPYDLQDAGAYERVIGCVAHLDAHPRPEVAAVWSQLQVLQLAGLSLQFGEWVLTGSKLGGEFVWFSPTAGGTLASYSEAVSFSDAFQVDARILKTLHLCAELSEPPKAMKLASPCLQVLYRCWTCFAEKPLPANRAATNSLES